MISLSVHLTGDEDPVLLQVVWTALRAQEGFCKWDIRCFCSPAYYALFGANQAIPEPQVAIYL